MDSSNNSKHPILLLSKGADSKIESRLVDDDLNSN
jgi:hypothetical protein